MRICCVSYGMLKSHFFKYDAVQETVCVFQEHHYMIKYVLSMTEDAIRGKKSEMRKRKR